MNWNYDVRVLFQFLIGSLEAKNGSIDGVIVWDTFQFLIGSLEALPRS